VKAKTRFFTIWAIFRLVTMDKISFLSLGIENHSSNYNRDSRVFGEAD
jgi:hypothetical protein